ARLGRRGHLILFLDDVQWGDVDSAAWLGELLRPPDPPVLLLVGCYRAEDIVANPFLQALLQSFKRVGTSFERREVAVEALPAQETKDLALALFGPDDQAGQA